MTKFSNTSNTSVKPITFVIRRSQRLADKNQGKEKQIVPVIHKSQQLMKQKQVEKKRTHRSIQLIRKKIEKDMDRFCILKCRGYVLRNEWNDMNLKFMRIFETIDSQHQQVILQFNNIRLQRNITQSQIEKLLSYPKEEHYNQQLLVKKYEVMQSHQQETHQICKDFGQNKKESDQIWKEYKQLVEDCKKLQEEETKEIKELNRTDLNQSNQPRKKLSQVNQQYQQFNDEYCQYNKKLDQLIQHCNQFTGKQQEQNIKRQQIIEESKKINRDIISLVQGLQITI